MSGQAARVVVTGVGVVAAGVCGISEFAETLRRGVMPLSDVDREAGYHVPGSPKKAVLSAGLDLSRWLTGADSRRMSTPSRLAVAAARMAVEDAGIGSEIAGDRTAIFMSGVFGAVSVTEHILRTLHTEAPEMVSPFSFAESVANVAAAQIAISHQIQGTNVTFSQRESGTLTAVGRAVAEITSGRADRALVGAVEEIPPVLHALLGRLDALAAPDAAGGEVARPFDKRRNGFIAAEGAVVLVLESAEAARERKADVRAEIVGFGTAFDPTASRVSWGQGHAALAAALRRTVEKAGAQIRDVGRIVSGASGSIAGDRLEARTLRDAWAGNPLPSILAPKGVVGEYGGAFLAAAVLGATMSEGPATAGFEEPDPTLDIVPHLGGPLPSSALTLVSSLSSGGAASWLLLSPV